MLATQLIGSGSRRTLLLHGFLGSGRNLSQVARRWSELDPGRSFLLLDLTGHGASPRLPEGATLGTMARDVLETARAQGVSGPLSLVGHSMGGRVGLSLGRDHPGEIAALTLLDIAPGPIDPARDDAGRVLQVLGAAPAEFASRDDARKWISESRISRALTDWLLMNVVPEAGRYVWRIDRASLERFRPELTRPDLWPALEALGGRVACVRGGASNYVTEADVERLRGAGAEVVTIDGASHFVHAERPDAVVEALRRVHHD